MSLEEALTYITRFLAGFHVIEGYIYKYDLMVSEAEILAVQQ
ncbi:MAG: hypothetical protein ACFE94_11645 [Candidatus Hodarchaeota archaeon]